MSIDEFCRLTAEEREKLILEITHQLPYTYSEIKHHLGILVKCYESRIVPPYGILPSCVLFLSAITNNQPNQNENAK